MNNIYLIGFMGSGKSTLAQGLAQVLSMNKIDLDQLIEEKEQRSIKQIFEEEGEAYFRKLETYYLKETCNLKNTIVSTGGGAVGEACNRKFLKEQVTVYLDWPFEVLYERIAGDEARPLSKSYEQLLLLYAYRLALYKESATYHVICQKETPYLLVEKVVEGLKKGGCI